MIERLRIGERSHETAVSSESEDGALMVEIEGRSHDLAGVEETRKMPGL